MRKPPRRLEPWISHAQMTEPGLRPQDVPALLMLVEVDNKAAAAYAQQGNQVAAAKALQETSDYAKKAEALTGKAVAVNPAAQPTGTQALPAKLVVTASKKQLLDVGSGKMTFEMFCQAATVEYANAPAAADKK